jgi:hypothetical protein
MVRVRTGVNKLLSFPEILGFIPDSKVLSQERPLFFGPHFPSEQAENLRVNIFWPKRTYVAFFLMTQNEVNVRAISQVTFIISGVFLVALGINAKTTYYVFISRHQNAGQNHNVLIAN